MAYGIQVNLWLLLFLSAIMLSGVSSSQAAENEEIRYSLTIYENPSIHVEDFKVVEGFRDIEWLDRYHRSKMPETLESLSDWQACFSKEYASQGTLEKWTESFVKAKTGEAEPPLRSTFTSLGAVLFFEDEGQEFALAYVSYGIRFGKVRSGFKPVRKAEPDEWDLEIGNIFLKKEDDGWKITWAKESPIFERLLRIEGDGLEEIQELAGKNITVLSGKKE